MGGSGTGFREPATIAACTRAASCEFDGGGYVVGGVGGDCEGRQELVTGGGGVGGVVDAGEGAEGGGFEGGVVGGEGGGLEELRVGGGELAASGEEEAEGEVR